MRGKPEKFADHYTQATLFLNSQTPVEKAHIISAFRFELTKVQVPAIRERVVAELRNVADELAQARRRGPRHRRAAEPLPQACSRRAEARSERLAGAVAARAAGRRRASSTRRIAILVADGVDGAALATLHDSARGRRRRAALRRPQLGRVETCDGGEHRRRDFDGDRAFGGVGRDGRAGR